MSTNLEVDAKSSIERYGLYLVRDAEDEPEEKGQQFAKFYANGYRTRTPEGLDFIFKNTLGDPGIRSIIHSIINQPRFGYVRFFSTGLRTETQGLSPEYAWFFHQRNPTVVDDPIHTLVVQFWLPGSKVTHYRGSQLQFFDAKEDPQERWGIKKTPRSNMKREGVTETLVHMPNGGYTIIDSRIGWTCEYGGFMNIGYAVDWVAEKFGPMELPDTPALRAKVAELEGHGIKAKLIFTQRKM